MAQTAFNELIPIVLGLAGAGLLLIVVIAGVRLVYGLIQGAPHMGAGGLGDLDVDEDDLYDQMDDGFLLSIGDSDGPDDGWHNDGFT